MNNKTLVLTGILFLIGLCFSARSESAKTPQDQPKSIVLFITGYELGALKPCGCSDGQLGGLDRRGAIFNRVPQARRMILDVGSLVSDEREQDMIKIQILFDAFRLLQYDIVHLTEQDVRLASTLGLLGVEALTTNLISSSEVPDVNLPTRFSRPFTLKDQTVEVQVVAARPERFQDVNALLPKQGEKTYNILLTDACIDGLEEDDLGHAEHIDCVVCPSDSDDPRLISDVNDHPLILSVGRRGRHVVRLDITEPENGGPLQTTFTSIAVSEDRPEAPELMSLYKDYQDIVHMSHLLEQYPKLTLPRDLAYEGSASCQECHEYEYRTWSTKGHAHAYATLERVGSQYDPECVICHVVGMEYESGFYNIEETNHLKDVGCEVCHGPGSEHNRTQGKAKTTTPQWECLKCHTPEHSAGYAGHEQEFMEKIRHWKEQKDADNVQ